MGTLDRTKMDPAQPSGSDQASENRSRIRKLGSFRLLRLLGEGGMGAVYLAYHPELKKEVALKILAEQYAENQSYIDRFYREAKSGALLNHPNIVRSLGVGQDKATRKHYLVLEYVDGVSALDLVQHSGRLSIGDAVRITYDIARGLEHAHSRNIIHRDIKPDNILLTRSGVAKLADLGLAKRTDEVSHLTATRQGFGTPHYMPYEQAINAKYADNRSDIYALGATLYHLLTGQLPFPGESHLDVIEKKDLGQYLDASDHNEDVPPILDRILSRMLARDPRDRYQTASELIVELERSRLASAVPGYADPDLALQDPIMREQLAASGQPTQPDLNEAITADTERAQPQEPSPSEQIWIVRFSEMTGRRRKLRLTTPQLATHLRQQRIPCNAEARRIKETQFQALSQYPELRELITQLEKSEIVLPKPEGVKRAKKAARKPRPKPVEEPSSPSRMPLFISLGTMALLVSLVLYFILK